MEEKRNGFFRVMRPIVIVFWVMMMGILIQRTYFIPGDDYTRTSYAESQLRPKEEWMGIYWGKDKVGYTVSEIKKELKGYKIFDQAIMDLTVMGTQQRIDTQVTSHVDNAFTLKSFEFRLFSNLFTFKANGEVRGNELHLELLSGGSVSKNVIPLKEVPCLSNSLKPLILSKGLAVGKRFNHTVFDPSTMSSTPIDMVVEGKEKISLEDKVIECYRIKSTFKGITLRSWIDEEGNTIKEESPLGLILVKESKADAITENWSEKTKDIIAASAISVNRPITLSNPSYLKVKLKNVNLGEFDLSQGRQRLKGDVLEIFKEKMSGLNPYHIPYQKSDKTKYLNPSVFIQSEDKLIVEKAREIIYQTIEKKPTFSIPSAVDILKMKVGDCNEHATLFVALCRAVGIPSKLCAGLVYNQGSFYYHAWSDVFVGRWISVDPTMNQLPADATHIRFVEGGLDKQLEIIRLIGILQLEVLNYT
ncbi:MAG: transglutaminase domain-containing protein [Deltaproteobacteria bacterium]|nr:transglutaminase domain-containing protein [Deltaproteobacteria bacterium]